MENYSTCTSFFFHYIYKQKTKEKTHKEKSDKTHLQALSISNLNSLPKSKERKVLIALYVSRLPTWFN